jgi:hypothetical protein
MNRQRKCLKMPSSDLTLEAPWVGQEPPTVAYPPCPFCGSEEAETFYYSKGGELFGCDKCIQTKEYWEANDEQGTIHCNL